MDFPGGSGGKESACKAGDPGSIPGLGRSSGEGNGNPFQYSCLENSMDRGAWRATVHEVAESDISEWTHINIKLLFIQIFRNTVSLGEVNDTISPCRLELEAWSKPLLCEISSAREPGLLSPSFPPSWGVLSSSFFVYIHQGMQALPQGSLTFRT